MTFVQTLFISVGLLCFVVLQLVAIKRAFTDGIGEFLRVFLIPGYALWVSCTDETWGKWVPGVGVVSFNWYDFDWLNVFWAKRSKLSRWKLLPNVFGPTLQLED